MFIAMPKIAPSNAVKRIKTTVQRLTPQRLASLKAFSIIQQASNPKNIVLKTLKHQPSKNAEPDKPQLIYADNLQNNQWCKELDVFLKKLQNSSPHSIDSSYLKTYPIKPSP